MQTEAYLDPAVDTSSRERHTDIPLTAFPRLASPTDNRNQLCEAPPTQPRSSRAWARFIADENAEDQEGFIKE